MRTGRCRAKTGLVLDTKAGDDTKDLVAIDVLDTETTKNTADIVRAEVGEIGVPGGLFGTLGGLRLLGLSGLGWAAGACWHEAARARPARLWPDTVVPWPDLVSRARVVAWVAGGSDDGLDCNGSEDGEKSD